MKKNNIYRGLFYVLGLLVLALGITLNTKAGLGVSPIISVSYSISTILNTNFGNMTLILYSTFVVVEMILHTREHFLEKKKEEKGDAQSDSKKRSLKVMIVKDALQFPLSLIFTRFMNVFVYVIPAYDSPGVNGFYSSFPGRIVTLIIAIALTGIGTVLAVIGVGRVIAVFNHFFKKKMAVLAGVDDWK